MSSGSVFSFFFYCFWQPFCFDILEISIIEERLWLFVLVTFFFLFNMFLGCSIEERLPYEIPNPPLLAYVLYLEKMEKKKRKEKQKVVDR